MSSRARPPKTAPPKSPSTRITKCMQRCSDLANAWMRSELPRIPEAETNSIPIDPGPAQFNAFYPQCSGPGFVSFPESSTPEHCG